MNEGSATLLLAVWTLMVGVAFGIAIWLLST